MNETSEPTKFLKFRIEQCENGWFMCINKAKGDEFQTRLAFTSTKDLCDYFKNNYPDKGPK